MIQANVHRHVGPGGGGGRRRRRAAARQDRHHHARQPPGDGVHARRRRRPDANWPTPPSSPRWPTRRPKGAASSSWPRNAYGLRGRDAARARRADSSRSRAQTRMSGVDLDGATDPQGRRRTPSQRSYGAQAADVPAELHGQVERHRPQRRHAAGRRRGPRGPRRHPPEGHRQGRHPGALRATAAHGHPDGDDHRRQSADRRGHRRRGRRRRLPRRGHAGGQAGADPRVPGRRPPGGHDRRRHQRRAGAGPGRRGRGHEHRHPGGQGSRQHGRPRLQSDQAHRDRRDRQAAADDPRRADHVQHRQRRGQVLRHHSRGLRRDLPGAGGAERHAPGHARRARSSRR